MRKKEKISEQNEIKISFNHRFITMFTSYRFFRFDLAFPGTSAENNEKGKKKKPRKKKAKSSKTKRRKTKANSKSRGRRITIRKPSQEPPPRPRVMPPPNWTPKKRNLREEPIPKFIRHSDCQKILL